MSSDQSSSELSSLLEELQQLKTRNNILNYEISKKDEEMQQIKAMSDKLQVKAEEEEEFITNNLLQKLRAVTKKKETIARQLETEEELMKNDLQKKLDKVRQEKVELEKNFEMEQENFVNKLQKQLLLITRQKNALERQLNEERSGIISKLEQSVGACKESLESSSTADFESVEHLEKEISIMRHKHTTEENEAKEYIDKCEHLAKQLEQMSTEKFILEARTNWYKEKLSELKLEREQEFSQFELSKERQFNWRIRQSSDDKQGFNVKRVSSDCNFKVVDHNVDHTKRKTPLSGGFTQSSSSPSCVTSCRSSPGISVVITPRGEPSPKLRERQTPRDDIKRHTKDVLNMSLSITSSDLFSGGESPR